MTFREEYEERRRKQDIAHTYAAAVKAGHRRTVEVLRDDNPALRSVFDRIDRQLQERKGEYAASILREAEDA